MTTTRSPGPLDLPPPSETLFCLDRGLRTDERNLFAVREWEVNSSVALVIARSFLSQIDDAHIHGFGQSDQLIDGCLLVWCEVHSVAGDGWWELKRLEGNGRRD
jgi:hypothetical protein